MQRRRGSRDTGAIAIEFALLMAFLPLTILACGIVDYGEVIVQATNLAAVVRGAAEYARGQVALPGGAMPTANDLSNLLGVPAAVFTTSTFCTCANNTPVACAGTCAGPDKRVLTYVAVSGSQTYTPLVSATWPFPPSVYARTVLRTQ
jgi:Flp pilus assembly pilin Flp